MLPVHPKGLDYFDKHGTQQSVLVAHEGIKEALDRLELIGTGPPSAKERPEHLWKAVK